ncbi:FAD-dependent oxidoreductase [Streptomyces qinglanensis]|uniref:FAD-dependent oxidoreductase n=1 Tax=Streptomyces qinglanensis TaxID=943816 RepID=A0A1E7K5P6_9ACTN|nr:FAD-dependent monooxygenase [Streptomyces qinglanensis]OEU99258.1 FAD-dependent oxidoreductase [Streptomyces qinglanensis]OEV28372.1 FAD-dependent oxidoreductase [Streptomyces nanshensis]
MRQRHALIIGGGIAGAMTAMSLHRAGISSSVHEAYPSGADDAGAFLVLFRNGLEALRTVDAHRAVLDVSFPAERVEMLAHTGDSVGVRPVAGGTGTTGALGPRTLRRATLHRALHDEAIRRSVTIEHGKRLVSADTAPDGRVTARFADGSCAEGDLLIGADGLHSVTRTLIDPGAPAPRHTGQITVCGYTPEVPPEAAPPPGTYRMIQGRRAFLGCTAAPDGEVWWFANTPGGERDREELATGTPAESARWRDHVVSLFSEDASPAAEIVRGSRGIVATNAYDMARTPVWHRASMVVLGDAAHAAAPNAAQGASMAIEDSVVLAKCLRDLPGVSEAFTRFESLRRNRVEAVVERSARLNDRVVPRPAETRPRARRDDDSGSDWLLDYRIDWGAPVGDDAGARA